MFRVLIRSIAGQPMLYRDFLTIWEAQRWADWAESTLPCTVEIGG